MMVRVYLHIGTAKTGTTTLQRFLCKNEKVLSDLGYLYPKSGRPANNPIAHYNLANAIGSDSRLYNRHTGQWTDVSNQFLELHQEIEQKNLSRVIISCESFSRNPKELEKLQQELSRYEVKILVYLRKQEKFLLSAYIESIKQGSYLSFQEYIDKKLDLVNYYDLLSLWSSLFGKDNLIIRIFEQDKLKGTIFEDFLFNVDIEDTSKFNLDIANYNVSPPAKTINFLRYLNLMSIGKLSLSYHTCRQIYINRFLYSKRWQKLSLMLPNFLVSEELDFDLEDYSKEFQAINQKVMAEYFQSQEINLFEP
ncbi:MAG: hypothetical protein AAFZ35_08580 [Cyanobacteria bacterium J06649_12]